MTTNKHNILIIGAHPDDIELGVGGTCHELRQLKHSVHWLHTTTGAYTDNNGTIVRAIKEIDSVLSKSAFIFDVTLWTSLGEPTTDLRISKDTIGRVQEIIKANNIDTVFTHPPIDTYHQDHIATHNIVMAAARRYVNNIYFFESIFNYADGLLQPTMYIPISNAGVIKKLSALKLHTTEYEKFGGEKWLDQIQAMMRYRGAQIGVEYAEAFMVQKQTNPFA